MQDKIIILDFGAHDTQLIARKIRAQDVYCEIAPYNKYPADTAGVKGVILSGSPYSVYDSHALQVDLSPFLGKVPVLSIGYGAQYVARHLGATITSSSERQYGMEPLSIAQVADPLLQGVAPVSEVYVQQTDTIQALPATCISVAKAGNIEHAVFKVKDMPTWGLQFEPESPRNTMVGGKILSNFIDICGCARNWTPERFIEQTVAQLKQQLGNDKVVLALSGGVDSSVVAVLLNKAIGRNLTCVFVDHGLLRKNEFVNVQKDYEHLGLNVLAIDAKERFYQALAGVTDPEQKRKTIGKMFIDVFDAEAGKLKDVKWLAQGTIYPDIIESVSVTGKVVKSHHNVGGLPETMKMQLVEPLKLLFKDEVRQVGRALGMRDHLVDRHPFPGPGLGVRILGDITPAKVKVLQEADDIFIQALRAHNLYGKVWQAGVVLLPIQSVGVTNGKRTYENAVALRAIISVDAMTASCAHLPYEFLEQVSYDIITKVQGVNRVVYDISAKPPATIEWE